MTAVHRVKHALVVSAMALGLVAAALGYAGAAWAHAARIASDPAENAQLTHQPARVNATFNEPMQSQFAAMTVIGPDGGQWSDGPPAVDGTVISVAVRPGGPAGTYTVNYRATSADGHVVTGSWSYQLLTADTSTTAAPPSTSVPS
ncbi:copper resistance protein CopC, partial [Mycobacterium sp. ITM-2017-0098]